MDFLRDFARREPLRLRAIIIAACGLAAALGFDVDGEAIIGLLVALGVLTETARAKVTPA
jgi:hypothetical protein